jgi:hypothetical protein
MIDTQSLQALFTRSLGPLWRAVHLVGPVWHGTIRAKLGAQEDFGSMTGTFEPGSD